MMGLACPGSFESAASASSAIPASEKSSLVDDVCLCNFLRTWAVEAIELIGHHSGSCSSVQLLADAQRWSEEKARGWYQQQNWLVGSNFIPATAINELEMWQAATFDPPEIGKETGLAQSLACPPHTF
jgi:hypothetical protein